MKQQFTLLFLSTFFALFAHAQQKTALIEEFTNDACPPCAVFSPVLDEWIEENKDDVVAIKYHGNYPNENDPIYLSQRGPLNAKINFYEVPGYPSTVINGKIYDARSKSVLSQVLDYYKKQPIDFNLTGSYTVSDGKLRVKAYIKPLKDINNEHLILNIAAIEEHIDCKPALPNGETELNYTCKHLLTGTKGMDIEPILYAKDTYEYRKNWTIENFNDANELAVVLFLQDVSNKKILASAYLPKQNNPSKGINDVNYSAEVPDNIDVYDVLGRKLGTLANADYRNSTLSRYGHGVRILKIRSNGKEFIKKVVVRQ